MIDLTGRRIAIVGGAGFIGHNLALDLAKRGAKVDIVDSLQVNNLLWFESRPEAAHRELLMAILNQRLDLIRAAGIPMHPQDARDYHAMSRVLATIKPQVLIHLAAVSHAGRSNKDPYSTFDHSLRTLENSLDFARGAGVEQFIFLSSSMAYGHFKQSEVSEDHPLDPIGIYGALKVAGEKMVIAYQQVFGLPYTIIRPSALYGQRCVSRRVSQIFIESALAGKPIHVDGDGSDKLDFTHIEDLVGGMALAIQHPAAVNQIFNLTYGAGRPIRELIEMVVEAFPSTTVEFGERDALMPVRGTLSIAKARELIGFIPVNPIEIGFRKYIDWYRQLASDTPGLFKRS